MKNTKTELRFFSIAQWQEEQDYLRQRHKEGWEFAGLSFLGLYHFVKSQPADVVYQLDYNPQGRVQKEDYIQLFQDCGWEYLQDCMGYSYFRKPAALMNGDEEIFCDDDSRLDMMKRVFKGRMLPLLLVFFLCIIPNIYLQSSLGTASGYIMAASFLFFLAVYVLLFLHFGLQYWNFWKAARR